jgi:hypothetical protein
MEELFGRDRLTEALRGKVREMIMALAEAELAGLRPIDWREKQRIEGGAIGATGG